jgi:hypothetical protein
MNRHSIANGIRRIREELIEKIKDQHYTRSDLVNEYTCTLCWLYDLHMCRLYHNIASDWNQLFETFANEIESEMYKHRQTAYALGICEGAYKLLNEYRETECFSEEKVMELEEPSERSLKRRRSELS